MALTKTLTIPAAPSASLATVFASAMLMMRAATPAGSIFPILVRLIARSAPKAMLPSRFPRNTHDQFAMMAFQVALP